MNPTIALANAYLCISCDHISECTAVCPVCCSTQVFPLAGWLNREAATTAELSEEVAEVIRETEHTIFRMKSVRAMARAALELHRARRQRVPA